MQRLRKLWQGATFWNGLTGGRLTEYILIGAYSSVALFALVVGLTAKAGTLFGRAVENGDYATKPELRAIFKQLMMASADFGAGASVLVVAVALAYWNRRTKGAEREPLESTAPSGPPFLF